MANESVTVTQAGNASVTATQNVDSVTVSNAIPASVRSGGTITGALSIDSTLTVGVDGTGHDVKFFGDTSGKYMQWDQSADKLFINGELEVNGGATTFNSTVITIDDPIFSLGGQQRTDALDDSKDRGIEFFYHDGAQKTGFMGYDDSADAFTFLTSATNSNEVFSGTAGNLLTGNITADSASSSGHISIARNGLNRLKSMLANNDGGWQYEGSSGNVFYAGASGNDYVIRDGSFSTSGDLRFIVSQSGNVGIGTAAPSAAIEISSSSDTFPNGYTNNLKLSAPSYPALFLKKTGNDTGFILGIDGNGLNFRTESAGSSTARITINNSGNVGIGTTNPSGKLTSYVSATRQINLHSGSIGADFSVICDNSSNPAVSIKGTGTADLLNVFDNTTEVFTILDGGNVGINQAAPTAPLHIGGGVSDTYAKIGYYWTFASTVCPAAEP